MSDTVAAISTPAGQGGIAVIRLSGPAAFDVAARVFRPRQAGKTLAAAPGYTALYGSFVENGQTIDDGIALCFRAPHSYTGEDVVELSCHGGELVSHALLHACLTAGALPAGTGEFTRRAMLNGKLSLTEAEAVMDLIAAGTRQAAALAHGSMQGALAARISAIKQRLVTLAGHLAAYSDYPEEDVEELNTPAFLQTVESAAADLQQLLDGYQSGLVLRRGVTAAIVGSPNVGKSTLFNLLSGFPRAIVTPVAGTTRDVVREQINIGGVPLLLSDTAGLHETDDVVEAEGIRRSQAELAEAGLIIAVFDASAPLTEADLALARRCQGRPALCLVNKQDLGAGMNFDELRPYFSEVLPVSATSPASRPLIEQAVLRTLRLQSVNPDSLLIANERQFLAANTAFFALQDAKAALEGGLTLDAAGVCLDDALQSLALLTGENASEMVINNVFSQFCVGK